MHHQFKNEIPVLIDSGTPTDVSSVITVNNVPQKVRNVIVSIDLEHTFTGDLNIRLKAPNGKKVLLVGREGGSGDNFQETFFDENSRSDIRRALPPFTGRFRPEESLRELDGVVGNGDWVLEVSDTALLDGGSLNAWTLAFTSEQAVVSNFKIEVHFFGGLSSTQQHVFSAAAQKWEEIIIGDSTLPNGTNVVISAEGVVIDGAGTGNGNILGQAAPTHFRDSSGLPSRGFMQFDSFDLARMEADGSLLNVIFHEMAHVLGHGTVWKRKGLLVGEGTFNPRFIGRNAMKEFGVLLGTERSTAVPVANIGGPGREGSHWRESVLGNELLTGRLNPGINPVSRLSIASFADLGYDVNMDAADEYTLPSLQALEIMGVNGSGSMCCTSCPSPHAPHLDNQ